MDVNQTVLPEPITEDEATWLASISSIGGVAALFIMGFLMDKLGRKTCILLGCVPKIIMSFILLFGGKVWLLLLGRTIDGVASVFSLATVPTYTSEISSKECRGALGTIGQIAMALGMLIILGVGPFISYFELNLVCACIVCLSTTPLCFVPESPYYLFSKGRMQESMNVLTYLRGSEILAQEEIKQYTTFKTEIFNTKFYHDKVFLKTFLKVIFLSILVQAIGYNVLLYYMQTILQSTQTTVKDEVASVIIGVVQLVASFCTVLLTDTFGRKPILIGTLFGMAIGMFGLGIFFKLKQDDHQVSGFLNYLPLISMVLVIYCNNAGVGAIFWTVVAELFDSQYRANGVAIGIGISTGFVFIMTKYFPPLLNVIGAAAVYFIFCVICVFTALFLKYFVPETKGKTFSEIQVEMGRVT